MSSINGLAGLWQGVGSRAHAAYLQQLRDFSQGAGVGLKNVAQITSDSGRDIARTMLEAARMRQQALQQAGESLGAGAAGYGRGMGKNSEDAADRASREKISADRNATDLEVAKLHGTGGSAATDPLSAQALKDATDIYMGTATDEVKARYSKALRDPHMAGMISRISGADMKAGNAGENSLLSNLDLLSAGYLEKGTPEKERKALQEKALRLVRNHGLENLSPEGFQSVMGLFDMIDVPRESLLPQSPGAAPAPASQPAVPDGGGAGRWGAAVRNFFASAPSATARAAQGAAEGVGDFATGLIGGNDAIAARDAQRRATVSNPLREHYEAMLSRIRMPQFRAAVDAIPDNAAPSYSIPLPNLTPMLMPRLDAPGGFQSDLDFTLHVTPNERRMLEAYRRQRAASQPVR